jgi:integrase
MLEFVAADQEALVFTGHLGGVLRTGNFRSSVNWAAAVKKAGAPVAFHFHDLRHTGNTLAAASGASTRELMHRMGHASMRAADPTGCDLSRSTRAADGNRTRTVSLEATRGSFQVIPPGPGKYH